MPVDPHTKVSSPDKIRDFRILILAWIVLSVVLHFLNRTDLLPFMAPYAAAATVFLLIYPTLWLAHKSRLEQSWWGWGRLEFSSDLIVFFSTTLIILIPATLINHFYQGFFLGNTLHSLPRETPLFGQMILVHLTVGISEEFFFRGYMQTLLTKHLPGHRRIFGVRFGSAEIITSVVFALTHSLITTQWWHPLIFFPALVFAWLRNRTGRIWAGAFFHAACNIFSYAVALYYY